MKLATALVALTLNLTLSTGAQAQQSWNISYPLTDFTTWTLLGDATVENLTPGNGFTYSLLRLTQPGLGGQSGAGFSPTALNIDTNQAFSFSFNFYIPGNGVRGDGFTFALTDTPSLGNAGSGLGYEGLSSHSVALAVDTFHFGGEPISPSVQLLSRGGITPLAYNETGLGDNIRLITYQWGGELSFTPSGANDNTGTLTGTIVNVDYGSYAVSTPIDFGDLGMAGVPLYFGFTAANGLATDGHFITSAAPVPEPGTWLLLSLGLLGLALHARRQAR